MNCEELEKDVQRFKIGLIIMFVSAPIGLVQAYDVLSRISLPDHQSILPIWLVIPNTILFFIGFIWTFTTPIEAEFKK